MRRFRCSSRCRREDDLPRPLSPSGASVLIEDAREPVVSSRSPVLDGEEEPGFAVARGSAIHKLLQVLPDMPEECARGGRASLSRARRSGLAGSGEAGGVVAGGGDSRIARFRTAVLAGIPRRSGDHGRGGGEGPQAARFRQDRPAGGDRRRGDDRRLQDQPPGPGAAFGGSAGLCAAARALPRPASAALSGPEGHCRAAVHRSARG